MVCWDYVKRCCQELEPYKVMVSMFNNISNWAELDAAVTALIDQSKLPSTGKVRIFWSRSNRYNLHYQLLALHCSLSRQIHFATEDRGPWLFLSTPSPLFSCIRLLKFRNQGSVETVILRWHPVSSTSSSMFLSRLSASSYQQQFSLPEPWKYWKQW